MLFKPWNPRVDHGLVLPLERHHNDIAITHESDGQPHVKPFKVTGLNVGKLRASVHVFNLGRTCPCA